MILRLNLSSVAMPNPRLVKICFETYGFSGLSQLKIFCAKKRRIFQSYVSPTRSALSLNIAVGAQRI
jgi:hypothetical protein